MGGREEGREGGRKDGREGGRKGGREGEGEGWEEGRKYMHLAYLHSKKNKWLWAASFWKLKR